VTLHEELRIDGIANDLVPIGSLAVARDGGIVITQPQDHGIRLFASTGVFLGFVGGPGEGPGEFADVSSLGWVADSLWAFDFQQKRLSLFGPDRQPVRTYLAPMSAQRQQSGVAESYLSNLLVLAVYSGGDMLAYGFTDTHDGLVRITPEGNLIASLAELSTPESAGRVELPDSILMSPPFSNTPRFNVSDEGSRTVVVRAALEGREVGTFEVSVFDASGALAWTRTYPFDQVAISSAARDSAFARATRRLLPRQAEAYRARAEVPSIYPPLEGVVVGQDSTVWLRLRDTCQGRPYLVLDPNGEPLAMMLVLRNVVIASASREAVWTLERDAQDVQSVVRYAVVQ
jgi:hypothetical protein